MAIRQALKRAGLLVLVNHGIRRIFYCGIAVSKQPDIMAWPRGIIGKNSRGIIFRRNGRVVKSAVGLGCTWMVRVVESTDITGIRINRQQ